MSTLAENQRNYREENRERPAIIYSHLLFSIISCFAQPKKVKRLKRYMEVFPCALYDGYII